MYFKNFCKIFKITFLDLKSSPLSFLTIQSIGAIVEWSDSDRRGTRILYQHIRKIRKWQAYAKKIRNTHILVRMRISVFSNTVFFNKNGFCEKSVYYGFRSKSNCVLVEINRFLAKVAKNRAPHDPNQLQSRRCYDKVLLPSPRLLTIVKFY